RHPLIHARTPTTRCSFLFLFFDTATSDIYTLSLHDALPISRGYAKPTGCWPGNTVWTGVRAITTATNGMRRTSPTVACRPPHPRSEEHTSELQSRENLVCRLLLEKKKIRSHNQTIYLRTNDT